MADETKAKRSYTVPVLLIMMMVMMTLIIVFYSKNLLIGQARETETGQRIAERYGFAEMFADRLQGGAEGMLNAKTTADKVKAAELLGGAKVAAGEAIVLFADADRQATGQSAEEAIKPYAEIANRIFGEGGALDGVGQREGALTERQVEALTLARDVAADVQKKLGAYRPLTGEAGYRQMEAGGQWIPSAAEAGKAYLAYGKSR
ncbi:hypothetical protein ACFPPD_00070 [Cohnella suwonensis]|uniref:Flp pilus-assembly TadG-like N-terminal domain-containing protein n=1 Tax=Cohnella suwonensis TaxID=696072 RepID=A0ABW0LQ46_9BACL